MWVGKCCEKWLVCIFLLENIPLFLDQINAQVFDTTLFLGNTADGSGSDILDEVYIWRTSVIKFYRLLHMLRSDSFQHAMQAFLRNQPDDDKRQQTQVPFSSVWNNRIQLIDWSVVCLTNLSIDWSFDCLIDWLMLWLIDWCFALIDGLIDWLICFSCQ